jgi:hypothetical protein
MNFTEDNYTIHKGGDVIDVERYYYEPETMCMRAHPSREDLADKMRKMISNRDDLKALSVEARRCAEDNYDWDKLIVQWESVLDLVKPLDRSTTWDSPIQMQDPIIPLPAPSDLGNEQYVEWLYLNILKYPAVDTAGAKIWIQHLEQGVPRDALMKRFVDIGNQQADSSKVREQIRAEIAGQRIVTGQDKRVQEFV